MAPDLSVFPVHGDPGEVANMLIGAGELIKQRGFAAVLIAYEGKGKDGSVGKGISAALWMVFAFLTKAGMCGFLSPAGRFGHNVSGRFLSSFHINLLGIRKALGLPLAAGQKLYNTDRFNGYRMKRVGK